MKVTAIILAGGQNRRFGRNKALEPIEGQSLIERVIESIKPLTSQILVVTSPEKTETPFTDKVEVLTDLYPARGPLGGIYTGLQAARSRYSIVVACDMPFLNASLLRHMLELAHDFDAVVPQLDEAKIEPLHAIYARSCLAGMKSMLEQDQLRINSFLKTIRVRYIDKAECQELDPELLSFFNINYRSDLELAMALSSRRRPPAETHP